MNQQIIDYLTKYKDQYSYDVLKSQLINSGFKAEEIEEAHNSLNVGNNGFNRGIITDAGLGKPNLSGSPEFVSKLPGISWVTNLILMIFLGWIYIYVWIFRVRGAFNGENYKKIHSTALWTFILMIVYTVSVIGVQIIAAIAAAMSDFGLLAVTGVLGFFVFVLAVAYIIVYYVFVFAIRKVIMDECKIEVSGALTFFFAPIYLQYIFNKVQGQV